MTTDAPADGEEIGPHSILMDIQGTEDHYGDMDFKVAGTATGITAIQVFIGLYPSEAQALACDRGPLWTVARCCRLSVLTYTACVLLEYHGVERESRVGRITIYGDSHTVGFNDDVSKPATFVSFHAFFRLCFISSFSSFLLLFSFGFYFIWIEFGLLPRRSCLPSARRETQGRCSSTSSQRSAQGCRGRPCTGA